MDRTISSKPRRSRIGSIEKGNSFSFGCQPWPVPLNFHGLQRKALHFGDGLSKVIVGVSIFRPDALLRYKHV